MDTRQGFIDTTQELNVDQGTPTSAGLAQISQDEVEDSCERRYIRCQLVSMEEKVLRTLAGS
jgi:hypothetical protein